jgi:polysaccharide pyruvyl transferase WcaK-like protein
MDILIDHGSMRFDNLGDIAMLQVCAARLAELQPSARLRVLTHTPTGVTEHLPGVESLELRTSQLWDQLRVVLSVLGRLMPGRLAGRLEARAALSLPSRYRQTIVDAIEGSDLYVHAGAGILTDAFPSATGRRLFTIGSAIDSGVPTVLFSQGIGPLDVPGLQARARSVLPRVTLIGVRDMGSLDLVSGDLGVAPSRAHMTGDDALAIGYRDRPAALGQGLGVNVRRSRYASLRSGDLVWLADQLRQVQVRLPADQLEPIPLAIHWMDRQPTEQLLSHVHPGWEPMWHAHAVPDLIGSIGRCRLVICTSYHAAVLALAQGIPALCLYRSRYYRHKYGGLCDLFPAACRRIDLGQSDDRARFVETALALLDHPEDRRAAALESTSDQIARSKRAYQLVGGRLG